MQQRLEATCVDPESNPGPLTAATMSGEESAIDPTTLASLDVGLFKCLRNIGTSRQRICSALCLSYAEYDDICGFLQKPR
jgi:hypothetical protein